MTQLAWSITYIVDHLKVIFISFPAYGQLQTSFTSENAERNAAFLIRWRFRGNMITKAFRFFYKMPVELRLQLPSKRSPHHWNLYFFLRTASITSGWSLSVGANCMLLRHTLLTPFCQIRSLFRRSLLSFHCVAVMSRLSAMQSYMG